MATPLLIDEQTIIASLYDLYGRLAFGLACRILHDPSAAEDVVQEAFLSVWRNLGAFDASRGHVRSWLLAIVRNRAIDRLRATSKIRREAPIEALGQELTTPDSWDTVALHAEREQILNAFAKLSVTQRQTITLAYFGGYTHVEIATKMGVPLGTVKGRMRCGLVKLRDYLTGAELQQPSTTSNRLSPGEIPASSLGLAG